MEHINISNISNFHNTSAIIISTASKPFKHPQPPYPTTPTTSSSNKTRNPKPIHTHILQTLQTTTASKPNHTHSLHSNKTRNPQPIHTHNLHSNKTRNAKPIHTHSLQTLQTTTTSIPSNNHSLQTHNNYQPKDRILRDNILRLDPNTQAPRSQAFASQNLKTMGRGGLRYVDGGGWWRWTIQGGGWWWWAIEWTFTTKVLKHFRWIVDFKFRFGHNGVGKGSDAIWSDDGAVRGPKMLWRVWDDEVIQNSRSMDESNG